jgi:hypothetical protein
MVRGGNQKPFGFTEIDADRRGLLSSDGLRKREKIRKHQ